MTLTYTYLNVRLILCVTGDSRLHCDLSFEKNYVFLKVYVYAPRYSALCSMATVVAVYIYIYISGAIVLYPRRTSAVSHKSSGEALVEKGCKL